MTKQEQLHKKKKSISEKKKSEFDQLVEDARKSTETSAAKFIPRMIKALRDEDPNIDTSEIRSILRHSLKDIWSQQTIYNNLPADIKPQKDEIQKVRRERTEEQEIGSESEISETGQQEEQEEQEKQISVTKYNELKNQYKIAVNQIKEKDQKIETLESGGIESLIAEQEEETAKTRYYAFNIHDSKLGRDLVKFLRSAREVKGDLFAKVENSRVTRLLSPEEKDKELETLAQV